MTPAAMLRRIRDLAAVSSNIHYTTHARRRMRQRAVTPAQVERALRTGVIEEGPALDIHGNWKCTMRRFTAGTELRVAVAIDNGLIVITVM